MGFLRCIYDGHKYVLIINININDIKVQDIDYRNALVEVVVNGTSLPVGDFSRVCSEVRSDTT